MKTKKMLNLGCGGTYDDRWTNVDLYKTGKNVIQADLTKKLPFNSSTFDVVYCSHLLEHFNIDDGEKLLCEIYRILKKDGVVRIVVPDLEKIAEIYLQKIRSSMNGEYGADDDYNWILLELYDQVERNTSGGNMLSYILNPKIPNKKFVISRVGKEAENILATNNSNSINRLKNIIQIIRIRGIKFTLTYIYEFCVGIFVRIIGGKRIYKAYKEGIFRNSGEVHKHMYDRYSLARVLKKTGFKNVKRMKPTESNIPSFNEYQLDVINNKTRKPDSLFMEAIK